jgi:dTDP-glucose 4,6-dehydratase
MKNKEIPVYGDGMQVRDWIFVEDHCSAIYKAACDGRDGEVYNIGGGSEISNIELVKSVIRHLGKSEGLIRHVPDRPGHDRRYAINSEKISSLLSWRPSYDFEEGLEHTIKWYLDNKKWLDDISSGGYKDYYSSMYKI